jgi:adenylosuccinate synthase
MSSLVVVGAQWGDEGKGKIVDYFTEGADLVARFHGGNNAGHTIVVNNEVTKLSVLPSGILHSHVTAVIGAGVVINGFQLKKELDELAQKGIKITSDRLLIDERADLILEYHIVCDQEYEKYLAGGKIGTTGRGIGPTYMDRVARVGVRVGELRNIENLKNKVLRRVNETNIYLKSVLKVDREVRESQVIDSLYELAKILLPFAGDVSSTVYNGYKLGKNIIFEGAQGSLLDISFGTFPYVTSSNTISGAVCTGIGVGPKCIDYVLGVVKAYCTRVGEGPFLTEDLSKAGEMLRTKGGEFGVVTKRPRRCGWFDVAAVRTSIRLSGIDSLVITKLDVLSGLSKIPVCIGYRRGGEVMTDLALFEDNSTLEPIYEEILGWNEDISNIKEWSKLPDSCKFYLDRLASLVNCPISLVSVGPDRTATIWVNTPNELKTFIK